MKKSNRFRPTYNQSAFRKFLGHQCVIVAADVETEGLDCLADHIIQISMLKYRFDGTALTLIDSYDSYVKNVKPLDDVIVNKIGITEEMLADAPLESDVFPAVKEFLSDADVFMTYNEPFDYGFVSAMYERNNADFCPRIRFDILAMVCDLITMYKCNRKDLGSIAAYLDLRTGEEVLHNSLEDIKLSVKVFEKLFDDYVKLSPPADMSSLPVPKIFSVWGWQNEKNWLMDRIYFATSCGKIFFEKKDRSFGCDQKDKAYSIDELNLNAFAVNALKYFNLHSIEDLAHYKLA